jgi:hypothetical protein
MLQNNKEEPTDMKRQLISLMIILALLSLFSLFGVYAQKGDAHLGPLPPKPKPVRKSAPKSKRPGLTTEEFSIRYGQIYYDYANSKASLDVTLTKLEELVKLTTEDSARAITNQFLGLLYLHGRHDTVRAEGAMEQAIKANGSAIVEITFDKKWRQMTKSRSGKYEFEDPSPGWIKIASGKILFTDRVNKPIMIGKEELILTGQQIEKVSPTLVSAFSLVEIAANNARKPYFFAAGDMRQEEADLVIRLIKKYVVGKGQLVLRRKGQLAQSRR